MSSSRRPVVAHTIPINEAEEEGPRYCIYTDAYGLEMTIDDEWEVDTILMAAPELVDVITQETGATEMGTVYAGASHAPSDGNFQSVVDAEGKWILLSPDDNIAGALAVGLNVILSIQPEQNLSSVLGGVPVTSENLIVAVEPTAVTTPGETQTLLAPIREACHNLNCADARVLLAAAIDHSEVLAYLAIDEVDGFLLRASTYHLVVDLLSQIADA